MFIIYPVAPIPFKLVLLIFLFLNIPLAVFADAEVKTGFIAKHQEEGVEKNNQPEKELKSASALHIISENGRFKDGNGEVSQRPNSAFHGRVKFGVIGGPVYGKIQQQSNLLIFRTTDYDYTTGITAGAFADVRIRRSSFFLRPEINYYEIESAVSASTFLEEFSLNTLIRTITLELPLRYEYGFGLIRPYMGGGVSVGFVFDNDATLITQNSSGEEIRQFNELESNIFPGVHAAAGAKMHEFAGSADLFTEFRLSYRRIGERRTNIISGVHSFSFLIGISF